MHWNIIHLTNQELNQVVELPPQNLQNPLFISQKKGTVVGAESGFLITRWQYEQNWHHNKLKVKLEKKISFYQDVKQKKSGF